MHPNIAGVKESTGDITKIAAIRAACGDDFTIWSGNDDQIVPVTALGGKGVISVLSNILPEETASLTNAALSGDYEAASRMQCKLLPLIRQLFCEVNPIPVKAAMELLGYDCGGCRLPLTDIRPENREILRQLLLN